MLRAPHPSTSLLWARHWSASDAKSCLRWRLGHRKVNDLFPVIKLGLQPVLPVPSCEDRKGTAQSFHLANTTDLVSWQRLVQVPTKHCRGFSLADTGSYPIWVALTLKLTDTSQHQPFLCLLCGTCFSSGHNPLLHRMNAKEGKRRAAIGITPTVSRHELVLRQTFCFQGSQRCQSCSFQSKSQVTVKQRIDWFQAVLMFSALCCLFQMWRGSLTPFGNMETWPHLSVPRYSRDQ